MKGRGIERWEVLSDRGTNGMDKGIGKRERRK